jgi:hypothetical protein
VERAYAIIGTVRNLGKSREELYLGIEFAVIEEEINAILARYVFTL